jgi:hypothetical protein
MSLNFDLSKTALTRDAEGKLEWTGATEYLIFATMTVGIGDLSEKNAPEFYARLQIIQDMDRVASVARINAADIKQHIGMTTNASYKVETRAQWLKRVVGRQMDLANRTFTQDADSSTPRPKRLT